MNSNGASVCFAGRGNSALHILDPDRRKEHLERLEPAGMDTPPAPFFRFDQPAMLTLIEMEPNLRVYWDGVISVYDIARSNGTVIVDILRRPMVIVRGTLQENP